MGQRVWLCINKMGATRENILPYAPIADIIRENSGKRVTDDAVKRSAQVLEELCQKIMLKANMIAENAGRKTVKDKDILLAYRQIKGGF